ncbi:MAG: hypothetical protein A3K77_00520 [Euryarchaeota archaeon RBG_13_31_8]|nr:MAG: hypothetical protein A3K77_00520 [Euryarchaeota archaeon RBG_13_31_8]
MAGILPPVLSLKIHGIEGYLKKLEQERKDKEKRAYQAMVKACLHAEGKIIIKITNSPRGGNTYTWRGADKGETPDSFIRIDGKVIPIKYRNIPHKASASGEPPAIDTGQLRNHVNHEIKIDGHKIIGKVGIIGKEVAQYAAYLEFGTTKIAPRPFLYKTIFEEQKNIREILIQHGRYFKK